MEAINNETIITESGNKKIRLTTHRLRYYNTSKKNSNYKSIMLDKISSIELTYHKSSIWLLIIGILTIPFLLGIVLIIIFFTSKRHVVNITPDGGKSITFETRGMKRDFLDEFIYKVEAASMKLKNK